MMRDSWGVRISGQKISINRLLKKFRDMGTVDRRQGSNRPRTDENIDQMNDMALRQQDQPRTHNTVREMSVVRSTPASYDKSIE